MKIIAIIEKPITSGGGFNQALNAIQQMENLSIDKFVLYPGIDSSLSIVPPVWPKPLPAIIGT